MQKHLNGLKGLGSTRPKKRVERTKSCVLCFELLTLFRCFGRCLQSSTAGKLNCPVDASHSFWGKLSCVCVLPSEHSESVVMRCADYKHVITLWNSLLYYHRIVTTGAVEFFLWFLTRISTTVSVTCDMVLSFVRIHHNQIVANHVLVPVIDSLRQHAKSRVHSLRVSM